MNTNNSKATGSLRRKITNSYKNLEKRLTDAPPAQDPKPQVVLDRQAFIDRGFCADCRLVQHHFTGCCNALVDHEWIPCGKHAGTLPGLPEINVTPIVELQEGICEPCSLRAIEEKKLANFLRIRDLSDKKWNKLKLREEDIISACDSAREMSAEEYVAWKTSKLETIAENARIHGLTRSAAKGEKEALESQIAYLTPRDQPNLAVR